MKEKNLLVTLADKNYIEQAKQLFSSVYWNAGWKGDYMLLSHEIPEKDLKWFREKGILIKKVKPLIKEKHIKSDLNYPSVVLSKLYLLTPYFKKWEKIIFLDSDIIVRDKIDGLLNVKIVGSVNFFGSNLSNYFRQKDNQEYQSLSKRIKMNSKAFNSGILSINTRIINKKTLNEIMKIFYKYRKIIDGDDPLLNIYFYKKWRNFPLPYNMIVKEIQKKCKIPPEKIKGIIIHFSMGKKPWEKDSPFYPEWEKTYKLHKKINLKEIQKPKNKWTKKRMIRYCTYLRVKELKYNTKENIKKSLGIMGQKIKKISPKTYKKLKSIENKIRK